MLETNNATSDPALSEKPHLSDTIDFATDIAPYPLICLWAGVGSGKNTLIENIANGCPEKGFPKRTVLLISSRKSKVIETLNAKDLDISNRFTDAGNIADIRSKNPSALTEYSHTLYIDGVPHNIIQRSLVCTNAAIEAYHQYYFDPSDPTTHLWNRFDLIVWDEAHSLIMDSTYQSAPYHVLRLFAKACKRMNDSSTPPRCKNLIFMTGTPAPLNKLKMPAGIHFLDFCETCRHVSPRNIHFLDSACARLQIENQLSSGERVIYFANHVALPPELSDRYNIPCEKIAVSFSEDERRFKMKAESDELNLSEPKESDYDRMVNVESHLLTHNQIRSDISLFYSTSRNKEGINILDDDIQHVYIESHSLTDIKQMAGRLRNGAEHIYIIMDSKGYSNCEHSFEQTFAESFCNPKSSPDGISPADKMLEQFCAKKHLPLSSAYRDKNSAVGAYIDLIKKKSPYIEFDYFTRKFRFNRFRKLGRKFTHSELEAFEAASKNPTGLTTLFQREFPNATIHMYSAPVDKAKQIGWDFMNTHPNGSFTKEEFDALIALLDDLLTSSKSRKQRKSAKPAPNRILHKIGLDYRPRNNNAKRRGYSEHIIVPLEKA